MFFIIIKGSVLLTRTECEVLAQLSMGVICKTSARNKNEKGSIEIVGSVVDISIFFCMNLLIIQTVFLNPFLFKLFHQPSFLKFSDLKI